MPELARFLGIVIRLYFEGHSQHDAPHVHAVYGEHKASFSVPGGTVLVGGLPRKQRRRVRRWG